ncbi:MAG: hypothetical protein JW704_07010, partial [Anaerolineaceae bacterium]|nr:hypothetical protein [Anaerolineaceae bacterium]
MARYSQEVLERLKRETDLPTLVRAKGIELKPHGSDLIGLCPFHNDTTPSLVLSRKDGVWLWHCLGECGSGGDVLEWVMKAEGVSFRHAVELLLNGNGHDAVRAEKIVKRTTVRYLSSPVEATADDVTLLNQVVLGYYHETLKKTPAALSYLEGRGLKSEEAL